MKYVFVCVGLLCHNPWCADTWWCACPGREWGRVKSYRRFWASFSLSCFLPVPPLLWATALPQHPPQPMGTEILAQQEQRCVCLHCTVLWSVPLAQFVWLSILTLSILHLGVNLLRDLCEKRVHLGNLADSVHHVSAAAPQYTIGIWGFGYNCTIIWYLT